MPESALASALAEPHPPLSCVAVLLGVWLMLCAGLWPLSLRSAQEPPSAPEPTSASANQEQPGAQRADEAAAGASSRMNITLTPSLSADNLLLSVWEAFRTRDVQRLASFVQSAQGHLLEDYPQFWYLQATLKSVDPAAVARFLKQYPDSPLSARLRADWLRHLADQQDWRAFGAEYPALTEPNAELACANLRGRLATGAAESAERRAEITTEARSAWLNAKGSHDLCNDLVDALEAANALTQDDLWQRMRVLLANNFVSAAKHVNTLLPSSQALAEKALGAAAQNPQRFLDKHTVNVKTRAGRELTLYALARLARGDAVAAVDAWSGKQDAFSEAERNYMWALLGFRGAQDHESNALIWFRQAGSAPLTEEQAAWRVRAALRQADWNEVLLTIGNMAAAQAEEPAWRYWKARALQATKEGAQAHALFMELSKQVNFYGVLAREELGPVLSNPQEPWKPAEAEVGALENKIGLQRALTLFRLGLTEEAREEWRYALRGFDDKQLLTAAEIARRANWYDRMISAADRTTSMHDFSMRYPVPYRDALSAGARAQQLDEAWVFGLVRQESRFIADARSSAGAMGLMQLMPATARWVAQRMGLGKFSSAEIRTVETNATLGSYYLKHVLDELGHPVLATAAYNAGPNRARRWMGEKPLEGAIYAETIPFSETRDYVKKVMANASIYAAQFGHQLLSLKERLGTIPARANGSVVDASEQPVLVQMSEP